MVEMEQNKNMHRALPKWLGSAVLPFSFEMPAKGLRDQVTAMSIKEGIAVSGAVAVTLCLDRTTIH